MKTETWEAWLFSAKLGWQRPFLRWVAVATGVIITVVTAFYAWQIVSARRTAGTVILHYNVYFGADEIKSLGWAALPPALWIALTLLDLAIAFGYYREDPHLSRSLAVIGLLWSLPWAVALYSLARLNS